MIKSYFNYIDFQEVLRLIIVEAPVELFLK